jgi:hypothetical protein
MKIKIKSSSTEKKTYASDSQDWRRAIENLHSDALNTTCKIASPFNAVS